MSATDDTPEPIIPDESAVRLEPVRFTAIRALSPDHDGVVATFSAEDGRVYRLTAAMYRGNAAALWAYARKLKAWFAATDDDGRAEGRPVRLSRLLARPGVPAVALAVRSLDDYPFVFRIDPGIKRNAVHNYVGPKKVKVSLDLAAEPNGKVELTGVIQYPNGVRVGSPKGGDTQHSCTITGRAPDSNYTIDGKVGKRPWTLVP